MKTQRYERYYALRYIPNWIQKTQFIMSLMMGIPLLILAAIAIAMTYYVLYQHFENEIQAWLARN